MSLAIGVGIGLQFATRPVAPAAPPSLFGTFADGQQGEDYSASLPIAGGRGPYTVNLVSGSIPPGFTLEVLGNELVLSGLDPN